MVAGEIVIVADLGQFKAYKAQERMPDAMRLERGGKYTVIDEAKIGQASENVKLDLIKDIDYIDAHKSLRDVMSDEPGQWQGGKNPFSAQGVGPRSHGQDHLEEDIERRIVKALVGDISDLIKKEGPSGWYLALPEKIYNPVLEGLDKTIKTTLKISLAKDLTKVHRSDLVDFFKPTLA